MNVLFSNDTSTRHRQGGVALLLALVVVALATVIVSGLLWRQFVLVRIASNQAEREQAHLFLTGALEWAKLILQDAPHPSYDTLADPWAQPLATTPLDQLGQDVPMLEGSTLEGSIQDAQGRFNLRNLVDGGSHINPTALAALQKLCNILGIAPTNADLIARHMALAYTGVPLAGPGLPGNVAATTPGGTIQAPGAALPLNAGTRVLPPVLPQDLPGVAGIDPVSAQILSPYVILLDQPGTTVNFNTASPQVMAAVIPDLTLSDAVNLAAERDRAYFTSVGDIANRLHGRAGGGALSGVSTTTAYFIVQGAVRLGRTRSGMSTLLHRGASGGNGHFAVLWQQET